MTPPHPQLGSFPLAIRCRATAWGPFGSLGWRGTTYEHAWGWQLRGAACQLKPLLRGMSELLEFEPPASVALVGFASCKPRWLDARQRVAVFLGSGGVFW